MKERKSIWLRLVATMVVGIFISSNTAWSLPQTGIYATGDSLENVKDQAEQAAEAAVSGQEPTDISKMENLDDIVIPASVGRVVETHKGTNGKVVVHIQDLHAHEEAQLNNAEMIDIFNKQYGIDLVCREGDTGFTHPGVLSRVPEDRYLRERAARALVREGEMSGAYYLAMTRNPDIVIWGVEDEELYNLNHNDHVSVINYGKESKPYTDALNRTLEELKGHVYNDALKALDEKTAKYESRELTLAEYANYLKTLAEENGVDILDGYDNFLSLAGTIDLEEKIDTFVANREYRDLITKLTDTFAEAKKEKDLQEVLTKGIEFRQNKVKPLDYYNYLIQKAESAGVDANEFSQFKLYVRYLSILGTIDNRALFQEMETLTEALKEKLYTDPEQRELTKALKHAKMLYNILNIKMTNEDLEYYMDHSDEFSTDWFKDFIEPSAKKRGVKPDLTYEKAVDERLPEMEHFYFMAARRDRAMVENTLAMMPNMKNSSAAVLIGGGYHTKGIKEELAEQGYSYVVVAPRLTQPMDSENYKRLISGDRREIQDIVNDHYGTMALPDVATDRVADMLENTALAELITAAQAGNLTPDVVQAQGVEARDAIARLLADPAGLDADQLTALQTAQAAIIASLGQGTDSASAWAHRIGIIAGEQTGVVMDAEQVEDIPFTDVVAAGGVDVLAEVEARRGDPAALAGYLNGLDGIEGVTAEQAALVAQWLDALDGVREDINVQLLNNGRAGLIERAGYLIMGYNNGTDAMVYDINGILAAAAEAVRTGQEAQFLAGTQAHMAHEVGDIANAGHTLEGTDVDAITALHELALAGDIARQIGPEGLGGQTATLDVAADTVTIGGVAATLPEGYGARVRAAHPGVATLTVDLPTAPRATADGVAPNRGLVAALGMFVRAILPEGFFAVAGQENVVAADPSVANRPVLGQSRQNLPVAAGDTLRFIDAGVLSRTAAEGRASLTGPRVADMLQAAADGVPVAIVAYNDDDLRLAQHMQQNLSDPDAAITALREGGDILSLYDAAAQNPIPNLVVIDARKAQTAETMLAEANTQLGRTAETAIQLKHSAFSLDTASVTALGVATVHEWAETNQVNFIAFDELGNVQAWVEMETILNVAITEVAGVITNVAAWFQGVIRGLIRNPDGTINHFYATIQARLDAGANFIDAMVEIFEVEVGPGVAQAAEQAEHQIEALRAA